MVKALVLMGAILSTALWPAKKLGMGRVLWAGGLVGRYRKRLNAQKARESDPLVAEPFREGGFVPRRAWVPSRIMMLVFTIALLIVTSAIFLVLTEIVFWASGLTQAITAEEAPEWVFFIVIAGWYCVLVAVMELVKKHITDGRIFPTYKDLLAHVRACKTSREVLIYASSLRYAAKMHIRSPYDFYRVWRAVRDVEDHSAYYRTERLAELLVLLEQRFPFTSQDYRFRARYWAYGRSIYCVLVRRDAELVTGSLFAQPLALQRHDKHRSCRWDANLDQRVTKLRPETHQTERVH